MFSVWNSRYVPVFERRGAQLTTLPLLFPSKTIQDRLYYCALKAPPSSHKILLRNRHNKKVPTILFNIDEELVYWNFFLDFGPLNLGQLYRFTCHLNQLLADHPQAVILFYSSIESDKRANAIFLISAWQVLELKRSPTAAFYGFSYYQNKNSQGTIDEDGGPTESSKTRSTPPPAPLSTIGQNTVAPLPPFHDASPCACTYELTLFHCLQGLIKAHQLNFFDWDNFDVEEYEYYEQVEVGVEFFAKCIENAFFFRSFFSHFCFHLMQNGDLNWICQGKILAFAGPSFQKTVSPEGYCTLAPADYIPYFQKHNVGLVVRLNKKNYEEQDFIDAGIEHLDQFYLDGSCPPMKILQRVLQSFEAVPKNKAFAVHCKAGLGRTGTCIGAYMMKHYRMTAPEVISWMRICRPGMVIGPQQQFLQDLEPVMWQEGEIMRSNPTHRISSKSTLTNAINSSIMNGKKKKKSSAQPVSPESPKSVKESVEGRPGQADGLLAARRNRHGPTPMAVSTPTNDRKSKSKAAPVTPDTASTKSRSTTSTPSRMIS